MKDTGERQIPPIIDKEWNTVEKSSYGAIYEKNDGSVIVTSTYDSKTNSMHYNVHFNPNFKPQRKK